MSILKKFEQYFEFEQRKATWTTELLAGLSLFLSLSYIFIVNPAILSQAGIPSGAVFFATVLAAGLATIAMGLWARLPFALAPGLESNGFFTFVVVLNLGFSWQEGLGIVFWSGVLCLVLTLIPARQKIIDAIPEGLKAAISTTVGVFVAIIGLVVCGLVEFDGGLPVALGDFTAPKAMLLYFGLAVSLIFGIRQKKFQAGMLVAIVGATVLAKVLGVPSDTPPAKTSEFLAALFKFELFDVFRNPRAWTVLLVFFMIDFYGSIGKFIGLTRGAKELQSEGEVKNIKDALYVDSIGTMVGSALGTSTIITYVESAVAVEQGGRTGVVAVVCGLLMLVGLVFSPLVAFVPVAAAGGVLVYVGWLLLPKDEALDALRGMSDKEGALDRVDFGIMVIMGLIAGTTFSLDKSLLAGFVLYSIRGLIRDRGSVNLYLIGSAVIMGIAMGFQYFGLD